MKKSIVLILALSLFCLFLNSCAGTKTESTTAKDDSTSVKDDGNSWLTTENACAFIVSKAGTSSYIRDIEINFDSTSASEESIKAAIKLCTEELNGLPLCKDAVIADYSCAYAAEKSMLSQEENAVVKEFAESCGETRCSIQDYEEHHHPCLDFMKAHDQCWKAAREEGTIEAIFDYLGNYYEKYSEL